MFIYFLQEPFVDFCNIVYFVNRYAAAECFGNNKQTLVINQMNTLAHFFIGLTCIVTQRNIVKQIFGYCLMENGSHVTLALLAPEAPELVEVGIATDAFFAVIIMAVVAVRIYRTAHTLDADDLMELKG